MDPITLTAVSTVLLNLLQKGAEKFAEAFGEDSWAGVKKFFSGHKSSDQLLDELKANPNNIELQNKFKKMFEDAVKANPALLQQVQASAPVKNITQNTQSGHNITMEDNNGTINIG